LGQTLSSYNYGASTRTYYRTRLFLFYYKVFEYSLQVVLRAGNYCRLRPFKKAVPEKGWGRRYTDIR
jgi:hypothetical protein